MKSVLHLILFSLLSFSLQAGGIIFSDVSFSEAQQLAEKEGKALFIDVFILGCKPCSYLSEVVFKNDELGKFMNEEFISIQVDLGKMENRGFKNNFSISAFPSMLFMNKKGELVRKIEGILEAEALKKEARDVIFPQESDLVHLQNEYKEGKRDKTLLQQLILQLAERDSSTFDLVNEYVQLHGLDYENTLDLSVLLCGDLSIHKEAMSALCKNIKHFYEVQPALVSRIIKRSVEQLIDKGVEQQDFSIIQADIPLLFPVYQLIIDSKITEANFTRSLQTKFEGRMFEKQQRGMKHSSGVL